MFGLRAENDRAGQTYFKGGNGIGATRGHGRTFRFAERYKGRFFVSGISGSFEKYTKQLHETDRKYLKNRKKQYTYEPVLEKHQKEELRQDAQRLLEMEEQLQKLQKLRELKRHRDRARRKAKLEYNAATSIQQCFRKFSHRRADMAVDTLVQFLRVTAAKQAVSTATWASAVISRFALRASRMWKEYMLRKRLAHRMALNNWHLVREVASIYTLARRRTADECVFFCLKTGLQNIATQLAASRPRKHRRKSHNKKHRQSTRSDHFQFFMTEFDTVDQHLEDEGESSCYSTCSEQSARSRRSLHRSSLRSLTGAGAEEEVEEGSSGSEEDEEHPGLPTRQSVQFHNKMRVSLEELTLSAHNNQRLKEHVKTYDPNNPQHRKIIELHQKRINDYNFERARRMQAVDMRKEREEEQARSKPPKAEKLQANQARKEYMAKLALEEREKARLLAKIRVEREAARIRKIAAAQQEEKERLCMHEHDSEVHQKLYQQQQQLEKEKNRVAAAAASGSSKPGSARGARTASKPTTTTTTAAGRGGGEEDNDWSEVKPPPPHGSSSNNNSRSNASKQTTQAAPPPYIKPAYSFTPPVVVAAAPPPPKKPGVPRLVNPENVQKAKQKQEEMETMLEEIARQQVLERQQKYLSDDALKRNRAAVQRRLATKKARAAQKEKEDAEAEAERKKKVVEIQQLAQMKIKRDLERKKKREIERLQSMGMDITPAESIGASYNSQEAFAAKLKAKHMHSRKGAAPKNGKVSSTTNHSSKPQTKDEEGDLQQEQEQEQADLEHAYDMDSHDADSLDADAVLNALSKSLKQKQHEQAVSINAADVVRKSADGQAALLLAQQQAQQQSSLPAGKNDRDNEEEEEEEEEGVVEPPAAAANATPLYGRADISSAHESFEDLIDDFEVDSFFNNDATELTQLYHMNENGALVDQAGNGFDATGEEAAAAAATATGAPIQQSAVASSELTALQSAETSATTGGGPDAAAHKKAASSSFSSSAIPKVPTKPLVIPKTLQNTPYFASFKNVDPQKASAAATAVNPNSVRNSSNIHAHQAPAAASSSLEKLKKSEVAAAGNSRMAAATAGVEPVLSEEFRDFQQSQNMKAGKVASLLEMVSKARKTLGKSDDAKKQQLSVPIAHPQQISGSASSASESVGMDTAGDMPVPPAGAGTQSDSQQQQQQQALAPHEMLTSEQSLEMFLARGGPSLKAEVLHESTSTGAAAAAASSSTSSRGVSVVNTAPPVYSLKSQPNIGLPPLSKDNLSILLKSKNPSAIAVDSSAHSSKPKASQKRKKKKKVKATESGDDAGVSDNDMDDNDDLDDAQEEPPKKALNRSKSVSSAAAVGSTLPQHDINQGVKSKKLPVSSKGLSNSRSAPKGVLSAASTTSSKPQQKSEKKKSSTVAAGRSNTTSSKKGGGDNSTTNKEPVAVPSNRDSNLEQQPAALPKKVSEHKRSIAQLHANILQSTKSNRYGAITSGAFADGTGEGEEVEEEGEDDVVGEEEEEEDDDAEDFVYQFNPANANVRLSMDPNLEEDDDEGVEEPSPQNISVFSNSSNGSSSVQPQTQSPEMVVLQLKSERDATDASNNKRKQSSSQKPSKVRFSVEEGLDHDAAEPVEFGDTVVVDDYAVDDFEGHGNEAEEEEEEEEQDTGLVNREERRLQEEYLSLRASFNEKLQRAAVGTAGSSHGDVGGGGGSSSIRSSVRSSGGSGGGSCRSNRYKPHGAGGSDDDEDEDKDGDDVYQDEHEVDATEREHALQMQQRQYEASASGSNGSNGYQHHQIPPAAEASRHGRPRSKDRYTMREEEEEEEEEGKLEQDEEAQEELMMRQSYAEDMQRLTTQELLQLWEREDAEAESARVAQLQQAQIQALHHVADVSAGSAGNAGSRAGRRDDGGSGNSSSRTSSNQISPSNVSAAPDVAVDFGSYAVSGSAANATAEDGQYPTLPGNEISLGDDEAISFMSKLSKRINEQ